MTAGPVPPIDHHDVGVGVLDQRVDEPHPERARADDEVVGLDLGARTHGAGTVALASSGCSEVTTSVVPVAPPLVASRGQHAVSVVRANLVIVIVTVAVRRVQHGDGDDALADRRRVEVARAVGQGDQQARAAQVAALSSRVPLERPRHVGEGGVIVIRSPLDRPVDPAQRILESGHQVVADEHDAPR